MQRSIKIWQHCCGVEMNIIDGDVAVDEVEETFDHRAQPDGCIAMDEINAWFALKIKRMTDEKIRGVER